MEGCHRWAIILLVSVLTKLADPHVYFSNRDSRGGFWMKERKPSITNCHEIVTNVWHDISGSNFH